MGLLWKKWMNFHYLGAWVDETGKDIMYGAEIWTLTRTLEKSYVDQLRDNTGF